MNGAKLEMFQPQPELFEGNRLRVRAAVSVIPAGETEPQFGAVWFEARVVTGRKVSPECLSGYLAARLSLHKIPARIHIVDSLTDNKDNDTLSDSKEDKQ